MQFDIIMTIEVKTSKYAYSITPSGTRNIDRQRREEETFIFKFDSMAIEKIIFREGPPILRVDGKQLYFNMKEGSLNSIVFENQDFIWIVEDPNDFLAQCREAYLRQKITERFLGIMDQSSGSSDRQQLAGILDEFEMSGTIDEDINDVNEDYLKG